MCFPAAGFALTYARNQPGFVCRVKGTPSNDPCLNTSPANAYWGLYWSDGKSGTWKYSSTGVGSVKVASGGFLAFSWQNGGANDAPSATPRNAKPAPTEAPTKSATQSPPKGSGGEPGQGGGPKATKAPKSPEPTKAAATKAATKAPASATPTPARSRSSKHSASARASASPTSSPTAASSTADDDASPAVTIQ